MSLLTSSHPFLPKSIVCLREGYGRQFLLNDLIAGVTVGIIAIPLAMAFAINSGPHSMTPQMGLYTAIIGGFIVSVFGGSRVSIAGPTGAFMPILYMIVKEHGYDGLCIASVMAGIILILMGVFKLGTLIKFIPYPVTTGFTAGIAMVIFATQMKDLFGLTMGAPSPEFVKKWAEYWTAFQLHGVNPYSAAIGIGGVIVILLVRRISPRIPGAIVVVVLASVAVAVLHLDQGPHAVETINSKFGGIPRGLPTVNVAWVNAISFERVKALIPAATTIALLAAIESLLCCVVADGMIGGRHKSNCELVAQGAANIGSILFGGIPATGAIARTAANVKSGGRTPLAGIVHAIFILACMLLLAPLAGKIPMPVFASVLVVVAWNMSEIDHFRTLFKAPRSDILVLLATFGLTVLADLTVAVMIGMVLAAMLFMKRMTEVTNVGVLKDEMNEAGSELPDLTDPQAVQKRDVPPGVEVYEIAGPFFFGVADRLKDTLREMSRPPKVFILRMRRVPAVDATGMHALDEFYEKCRRQNTLLLLAGVHAQPVFAMQKYGLIDKFGLDNMCDNLDEALEKAAVHVGWPTPQPPAQAVPEIRPRDAVPKPVD